MGWAVEAVELVEAGFTVVAAGSGEAAVEVGCVCATAALLGAVEAAAVGRGVTATGLVGAGVVAGVRVGLLVSVTGIGPGGVGCCVGLGYGRCETAIVAGLAEAVAGALVEDRAACFSI